AHDQIWISGSGCSLFGFEPCEELNMQSFRSRVHPDDRAMVNAAAAQALATGSDYETEYRVVRPNGEVLWLNGRGRVEFDPEARPVRMRGVSIDITGRKRAEEKFRVAVEASPIGIVLVNEQGLITL